MKKIIRFDFWFVPKLPKVKSSQTLNMNTELVPIESSILTNLYKSLYSNSRYLINIVFMNISLDSQRNFTLGISRYSTYEQAKASLRSSSFEGQAGNELITCKCLLIPAYSCSYLNSSYLLDQRNSLRNCSGD